MEIKKDISKLKQLDRIDYLLTRNDIEQQWGFRGTWNIIKWLCGIFAFLFIVMLLLLEHDPESAANIAVSILGVMRTLGIVAGIVFVLEMIFNIRILKEVKGLNKKFFGGKK